MTSHEPDHYTVLGVGRGASPADVDRAYRRAARATHPDIHPDDASAADRFRVATLAYETLRDPDRRASYDRSHPPDRPSADVRLVVRRRPSAAPVHLGRQPPSPIPAAPLAEGLFDLVEAFALFICELDRR